MTTCRRCNECDGYSHHWLPNTSFGDDSEREENNSAEYECKHCDALGMECPECDGDGRDNPLSEDAMCPECDGEGVILFSTNWRE